jgi:DNA-binding HxlR family transcriptional regulator
MMPDRTPGRSGCPINLTLEVLGDRWSLIVIRDIIFGNRRHFRELLGQSEEGIASNILAARLKRLMAEGILTRRDDPSHKQKAVYSLTAKGIDLLPLLVQVGAWGRRHLPTTPSWRSASRSWRREARRWSRISWPSCATCTSARPRPATGQCYRA